MNPNIACFDADKSPLQGRHVAIILGVPRSGTTLLRFLLGQHPHVAALPETPWILGGYGPSSFRQLEKDLHAYHAGPANTLHVPSDFISACLRKCVHTILAAAISPLHSHIILKTPDDIRHLESIRAFFPHASFIHICRDGRDVAISTAANRHNLFDPQDPAYGRLDYKASLNRWSDWEIATRRFLRTCNASVIELSYESLVETPARVIEKIWTTLGVTEPRCMDDYDFSKCILPEWESGSTDVRTFQGVTTARTNVWLRQLDASLMEWTDRIHGQTLRRFGYPLCADVCATRPPSISSHVRTAIAKAMALMRSLARAPKST